MNRTESAKKRPAAQKKRGKKARSRKNRWRTAANSDPFELYELSVQDAAAECDFIEQVWKERRRRPGGPRRIREDFCGSSLVCREWVTRNRKNTAVGIDLDPAILAWAAKASTTGPKKLKPDQLKRMQLIRGDVRNAKTPPPAFDTVLAMNFSCFVFKTRDELRRYFRSVHRSLVKDGIFLLDAYGGSESFSEIEEPRDFDGFTYVWDQNKYNPITGEVLNHIHFTFPDGSKLKKAFTYDWRLWTLPELQEILREAGFKNVLVYWEGTDNATGEGDGVFTISTQGEACAGWISYIVAEK